MKKFAGIFVIGFLVFSTGFAWAKKKPAIKIGFIDINEVFDEFSGTKEAKTEIDQEIKTTQDKLDQMEAEIDTLRKELETQKELLKEEVYKEKEAEIVQKEQTLQQLTGEEQDGLARKEAELTQDILKKIYQAVVDLGEEEDFDLILDKNSILYSKTEELDLTQKVLGELEEEAKEKKP